MNKEQADGVAHAAAQVLLPAILALIPLVEATNPKGTWTSDKVGDYPDTWWEIWSHGDEIYPVDGKILMQAGHRLPQGHPLLEPWEDRYRPLGDVLTAIVEQPDFVDLNYLGGFYRLLRNKLEEDR